MAPGSPPSPPGGYGRNPWTRTGRGVILDRYAHPENYERTTLRSLWYRTSRLVIREWMTAGKSIATVPIPTWSAWEQFVGRVEKEVGRTLKDAKIYREPRGAIYFYGEEMAATEANLARVNAEADALIVCEKAGPGWLLGTEYAGTGIAVIATRGVLVDAHIEAVRVAKAAGKPVILLSDFDAGGEIVARGAIGQTGARKIGMQELIGWVAASGRPFDMKGLVIPDTANWKNLKKTLGPERFEVYRELARSGGLPAGTEKKPVLGKVELDAVIDEVGAGRFAAFLNSRLDKEFPRPPSPAATPGVLELLIGRMDEIKALLKRRRPAPDSRRTSWAHRADPLEAAARELLRAADRLIAAMVR